MLTNSILLNTFEQSNYIVNSYTHDIGIPSKSIHIVYCLAGHKISAGQITLNSSSSDRINLISTPKEV